jgi:hypothetical protein
MCYNQEKGAGLANPPAFQPFLRQEQKHEPETAQILGLGL